MKNAALACLSSLVIMFPWSASCCAQYFSSTTAGQGVARGYNFSGFGSYFAGSPSYVPFGGAMGGFIPYSPGPAGGLGVQPGTGGRGELMTPARMGLLLGSRPSLGSVRAEISPLAPIGQEPMGFRAGRGTGLMDGMLRRVPSGRFMGGMARPPVGNYPFRQPPSLLGPGTSAPAMSM